MRKKTTKGKCEKWKAEKCEGVCKTFGPIQDAYVRGLDTNSNIKTFKVNIPLEGKLEGYTTDVVFETIDGTIHVRECISRSMLVRITSCELLESSREYWTSKGVTEWGIVINGN